MKHQIKKQSGFTLIELMIVVTIIGILASIAVPIYRDYAITAKVSECPALFAPIKTDTSVVYSANGVLPNFLTQLPRVASRPANFRGDYVSAINVGANGVTTCTLQGLAELGSASGGTMVFVPNVSTSAQRINWGISTASTVPAKYRPDTPDTQ